jgi:hypothetical protein
MNKSKLRKILFNTDLAVSDWTSARWLYNISDYLLWAFAIFAIVNLGVLNLQSYSARGKLANTETWLIYCAFLTISMLLATLMEILNERIEQGEKK